MQKDFKSWENTFVEELKELYPEREVRTLFSWLLEDVFYWKKTAFLEGKSTVPSIDETEKLSSLLSELREGKPYQYCVGFSYFYDLKLKVSPAVLIPRPETEELVAQIVELSDKNRKVIIEDWCTGSGCIALGLKSELPEAEIIGYDISEEALDIAKQNAENLRLDVDFKIGNALEPTNLGDKIDIIVSNPPYIAWDEKDSMHKNVVDFEPSIALFVDDIDVIIFYRKLLLYAQANLKTSGIVYFELHENHAKAVQEYASKLGFDAKLILDLQGKERMLKAQLK